MVSKPHKASFPQPSSTVTRTSRHAHRQSSRFLCICVWHARPLCCLGRVADHFGSQAKVGLFAAVVGCDYCHSVYSYDHHGGNRLRPSQRATQTQKGWQDRWAESERFYNAAEQLVQLRSELPLEEALTCIAEQIRKPEDREAFTSQARAAVAFFADSEPHAARTRPGLASVAWPNGTFSHTPPPLGRVSGRGRSASDTKELTTAEHDCGRDVVYTPPPPRPLALPRPCLNAATPSSGRRCSDRSLCGQEGRMTCELVIVAKRAWFMPVSPDSAQKRMELETATAVCFDVIFSECLPQWGPNPTEPPALRVVHSRVSAQDARMTIAFPDVGRGCAMRSRWVGGWVGKGTAVDS